MSPRWGGRSLSLCGRLRGTWLEIVGLTSTHSLGSGTQLLERGWTSTTLDLPRQYRVPKAFLGSLGGVLDSAPTGDSIVLLRGLQLHVTPGDTLGRRSMIDFVVVSSDLRPYVLDTRVKRGAELST
ncbi:hypothetical protein L3Q82_025123 [Scortum barcoo]|uniref:Uncharacterized protein n=1 Tax=Scortum barcoo TaxID=214431 RepID=A0ACB8WR97_9TELE|nr:hypothetical protein L3Q82_025123 [Scortum barcoo]